MGHVGLGRVEDSDDWLVGRLDSDDKLNGLWDTVGLRRTEDLDDWLDSDDMHLGRLVSETCRKRMRSQTGSGHVTRRVRIRIRTRTLGKRRCMDHCVGHLCAVLQESLRADFLEVQVLE